MKFKITEITLDRYDELIDFWKSCGGLWLDDDDSYRKLKIFLKRNPKLNFMVLHENRIIAAVKCSHDGRRGYIHHLAVEEKFRERGIARELVEKCLKSLQEQGITRYRVFVMDTNKEAFTFWEHIGFEEQTYNYRTFQMEATSANEKKT